MILLILLSAFMSTDIWMLTGARKIIDNSLLTSSLMPFCVCVCVYVGKWQNPWCVILINIYFNLHFKKCKLKPSYWCECMFVCLVAVGQTLAWKAIQHQFLIIDFNSDWITKLLTANHHFFFQDDASECLLPPPCFREVICFFSWIFVLHIFYANTVLLCLPPHDRCWETYSDLSPQFWKR